MQKFSFPLIFLTSVLFSLFLSSCKPTAATPKDLSKENLIPLPTKVEATGSSFLLTKSTKIILDTENLKIKKIAHQLINYLNPATGYNLHIEKRTDGFEMPISGFIQLELADRPILGNEGYELKISEEMIKLTANKPAGLFYCVQTLRQLLPPRIESNTAQLGPWEVATGTIVDSPEYSFRGTMLDVSRHFFSVTDVKRYIDLIAAYKMNVLHLHLTDDQGWRIEIKSWPNLTKHGGSTEVGGGKGGFYTQKQYSDIVKYAQAKFITIIPEIDMPGHTNAALASYPELNCDGKSPELYTGIEVGFSTLCTSKEITYKFVDDVVRELTALTPGPYIHIGGDESHVTKKEDYIPFINRVQDIVKSHNKIMIGWDEVVEASLDSNSIAQYWAESENALTALEHKSKIIMSPAKKAYLDMQYDSTTELGLHWAAYIELDSAYIWDMATLVPGIIKENVLGIEAPLWSETITNMEELEYMVFPRLPGYAEIAWTSTSKRKWDEYKERLGKQQSRFEAMDINFYPSKLVPWVQTDSLLTTNKIDRKNN